MLALPIRSAPRPAWRRTVPLLAALGAAALPLVGCARYRLNPRTTPERAVTEAPAPAGPLAFEEAVRLLVAQNPELQALRAHAGAVNLRPNETELEAGLQVVDGEVSEASVGADLLSLLGLGVRPAQRALAQAVRCEALARHHERARELVAELARAYAREQALAGLITEVQPLDARAYVEAGLATRSDLAESESSRAGWVAERTLVALARRQNRLEVARLIGAGPEAALDLVAAPPAWPPLPAATERGLLYARADLMRQAAAVAVADRAYRVALARQIPTLGVELGAELDPTEPLQVLRVALPLGAPAEARAAERARDAAVLDLEAAVLAARHDAARARLELEAQEAETAFWDGWWRAKHALVQAARQRTAVDPKELPMAVHLENEEIESARDLREALLHRAEARVAAAVAAGWPGPVDGAPQGGAR